MKDDSFIPMETETVEDENSAKSKVGSFLKSMLLFLVVVGLVAVLVIQIIIISATSQVHAADALDTDAAQAILDEMMDAAGVNH